MKLGFSFLILLISTAVFAGLTEDYEKIKNLGKDLSSTGAICEEIAQLRFQEKYPVPDYKVLTGIEYADRDGALGELDIIVFNAKSNQVEIVGEVKCWQSSVDGLNKARDQRQRFLSNLNSKNNLTFKWLSDPKVTFTKAQFIGVKGFYSVAQLGAVANGYDFELPYTLTEMMRLREDIMRCQGSGGCTKVKRH